jgi:hypothetical protein
MPLPVEREGRYEEDDGYLGTFRKDGFRLRLFDTGDRLGNGIDTVSSKANLRYEFTDEEWDDRPLFAGDGFEPSPMYTNAIGRGEAPDAMLGELLSFFALAPGDTDTEYFDRYTPIQKEWLMESGRVEELKLLAFDLENPPAELNRSVTDSGVEL